MTDSTLCLRGIPIDQVDQGELENAMARTYDRWAELNAQANRHPTKFMDAATDTLNRYNALRAEWTRRQETTR